MAIRALSSAATTLPAAAAALAVAAVLTALVLRPPGPAAHPARSSRPPADPVRAAAALVRDPAGHGPLSGLLAPVPDRLARAAAGLDATRAAIGVAAAAMLVSWTADLAVLAAAFLAVGAQPPWSGLVVAYVAGQIASALPITPGGLGVVEAGLTAALIGFGAAPAAALTAVLLYRLVSHWAVVPVGALAWLALARTSG